MSESACATEAHYFYDDAVEAARREWTTTGTWVGVVFCRCGGWRLMPE